MSVTASSVPANLGVHETLALLDEGALPAIAIDPRERVVRAVNGTLAGALGVEASELEDEPVHTIVDRKHHGLLDAILDALAEGANLGPTRLALKGPGLEGPRGSVWSRVPGFHEVLGTTLVLLCQPYGSGVARERPHDEDPELHPGFGRIPPFPRFWGR